MWVIRNYQPDIIIKRFPPDSKGGMVIMQHQPFLLMKLLLLPQIPIVFLNSFNTALNHGRQKEFSGTLYNFGNNNTTSENQLKIDIGVIMHYLEKVMANWVEKPEPCTNQGRGRPAGVDRCLVFSQYGEVMHQQLD